MDGSTDQMEKQLVWGCQRGQGHESSTKGKFRRALFHREGEMTCMDARCLHVDMLSHLNLTTNQCGRHRYIYLQMRKLRF